MSRTQAQEDELNKIKGIFDNIRNMGIISVILWASIFSGAKLKVDTLWEQLPLVVMCIFFGITALVLSIKNIRHIELVIYPHLDNEKSLRKRIRPALIMGSYFLLSMFLMAILTMTKLTQ